MIYISLDMLEDIVLDKHLPIGIMSEDGTITPTKYYLKDIHKFLTELIKNNKNKTP